MKYTVFEIENHGWAAAAGDSKGLVAFILPLPHFEDAMIALQKEMAALQPDQLLIKADEEFKDLKAAVNHYYHGVKVDFTSFLINWDVFSPFQRDVLKETYKIPYGKVSSYGEIAARLGKPKGSRAVGGALRRNSIPLLIPCHRVIQKNGGLGGFSGLMNNKVKVFLLSHEGFLSS